MEMILDTNALSALFNGDPNIENILPDSIVNYLPTIVIGEYRYGLLASSKRQELEMLLNSMEETSTVLHVDLATARHYAKIRHELKLAGRPIPDNDIWIAALARQHSLELLSRDRHFDAVRGLKRIGW